MFSNFKNDLKKEFKNIDTPNVLLKEEAYDRCKQNTSNTKGKIMLKPILISCVAVIVLFSSTFIASAEFRNLVISFFKSSDVEIIPPNSNNPNSNEKISFIGKQSINNIADIRYFELDGAFVFNNDIVNLRTENGLKYYNINDNKIREINFEATHVSDIINYNGIQYPLEFDCGLLDGEFYIENTLDTSAKPYLTYIAGRYGDNQVWIELGIQQNPSYYVLYNLTTGEVTDIIKDSLINVQGIEQFEISPNGTKAIVGSGEFYLLDIGEKKAISIDKSVLLENIASCTFVNNEMISILQKANEIEQSTVVGQVFSYNSYTFNLLTNEKTPIFENEKFYNQYLKITTGYIALGNGFYIKKTPEQYVLVNPLGERYFIAEIKPSDNIDFLLSPDQTKIAVTNISGKGNDGLKITELGIIDIQKKEFKIFDRQDFNSNYESSFFWNDSSSLAVTATNQNNYIYIYQFK